MTIHVIIHVVKFLSTGLKTSFAQIGISLNFIIRGHRPSNCNMKLLD